MTGDITSARLRIFARLTDASLPLTVMIVQKVTDTAWGEFTMTWNNQPLTASPNALAQITVAGATGQYYEFDLTSFIQQERAAGRNVVALRLINQAADGQQRRVLHLRQLQGSREQSTATRYPAVSTVRGDGTTSIPSPLLPIFSSS